MKILSVENKAQVMPIASTVLCHAETNSEVAKDFSYL